MGGDVKCEKSKKHRVQMCKLQKDGKLDEIAAFSSKPIVYCNKCKVKSNDPCSVCNPRALK